MLKISLEICVYFLTTTVDLHFLACNNKVVLLSQQTAKYVNSAVCSSAYTRPSTHPAVKIDRLHVSFDLREMKRGRQHFSCSRPSLAVTEQNSFAEPASKILGLGALRDFGC